MRRPFQATAAAASAAWTYLAMGAVATLVYALVDWDLLRAVIAVGLSAGVVGALIVGIRRYRPESALPWCVFAAAHAVYLVGWVFWEIPIVREGVPPASFSLADLFFLAAYPLFALGLLLLIRERDPGSGRTVEVAIIGVAAALASWTFLLGPFLDDEEIGIALRATQSVYALMDLLLLAVIARALLGAARGTAYLLVVAGLACLLAADTAWNWLSLAGQYAAGSSYDLGWLAFMVLVGTAALHPSMGDARQARGGETRRARWVELAVLALGALALPLAGAAEPGHVPFAVTALLSLLLLTRFVLLLRESESLRDRLMEKNRRLTELDQQKDDFIASVSHELRTPLTSIRGYLDLVREGDSGPLTDEQARFLGVVDRNADRLLRVVSDLLFVAQVGANRLDLSLEDIEVEELLSHAADVGRPQAEQKNLELACEIQAVPRIRGDRARLGQALDNLVSNAIKFTPAGGRVEIDAFAENGAVVLEVSDTGPGISPEEQEMLFERFYRTPAASDGAFQGTGLGLTIVKAIVEAHRGTIDVTSRQGAGTTFRIELPAGEAG